MQIIDKLNAGPECVTHSWPILIYSPLSLHLLPVFLSRSHILYMSEKEGHSFTVILINIKTGV